MRSHFQVREFDPSVRWKWTGRAIGLVIDYDHRFEPLDDRRTTLTWTVDAEGPRFAERLFARAYIRKLDRDDPQAHRLHSEDVSQRAVGHRDVG